MKKPILVVSMLLLFPSLSLAVSPKELAEHYAPVLYQDVNNDQGKCWRDYITNIDFDGNWVGNDNWENAEKLSSTLYASVYYHVAETSTHWFIVYGWFHPQDWEQNCWPACDAVEHENDFEGMLVVVKKDGSEKGQFILMETVAHSDFWQYANSGSGVSNDQEDIDDDVLLVDGSHPGIAIEDEGHGAYSVSHGSKAHVEVDPNNPYSGVNFDGGDGIVYRFEDRAEKPDSCNARDVGYSLVPWSYTIWSFAFGPFGSGQLFDSSFIYNGGSLGKAFGDRTIAGAFDGDTQSDDSASPPWGWDDHDDGNALKGDIAIDPAYMIDYHLNVSGDFSTDYLNNFLLGENMDLFLEDFTEITGVTKTYKAANSITARDYVIPSGTTNITLQAGSEIHLQDGFHAQSGSTFQAKIE